MGITEYALRFEKEEGVFSYTNAQGKKEIKFGRLKNILQQFPQMGYSKDIGGMKCQGHTYQCVVSAGWVEEQKLSIVVQIIDTYIGLLHITIGFQDGYALLNMQKYAEDFLEEYSGCAVAKIL